MAEYQRLKAKHQSPVPRLKIYTKGDPNTPNITYFPDPEAGRWGKLLSYTFSESTDSLEGAFSFTVEDDGMDKKEFGTVFDLIPILSVVKIYEGDLEHPAFVGVVRRHHFGSTMTGQGVKRTLTFAGKSIISLIGEYALSLDIRIHNIQDPMSRNIGLTDRLTKAKEEGKFLTIKDFMKITWKHFEEISESAGISTKGIADIINKFIGDDPGTFIQATGSGQTLRYDIACTFYNAANNVIADVWRNILPENVYEFFSRCEDGEPKIIARQMPFEPEDWSSLDLYQISPISLTAYELDRSDDEVYTAFVAYIIGSAMSKEFYMAVNQDGKDDIVVHDREKQKIYGFRPLELNFYGYDREKNSPEYDGNRTALTKALRELGKMAHYWYSRLDEMYSGSITVITDFNEPKNNPRAGCRAGFLHGEFYIKKAEHSWHFGGTPTIKLTVSRGMIYDMVTGKMMIPMGNIGRKMRELDDSVIAIVGFKPVQ